MGHSVSLISTLAAGFGAALVFGFLAEKIKMPSLVGYLLAGVLISPQVFGLDVDLDIASQLAEVGVMLLMFGVGLHFSLSDLLRIRYLVVPGTLIQMTLSAIAGFGLAHMWGWPAVQCIVFGMTLSCASTVVVLKALESNGLLESYGGQIAVGWLIVQDMVTVLLLVLLQPLATVSSGGASDQPLLIVIVETLARVASFIALMLIVGKRLLPWILLQVAKTGSKELFTLSVLACAIGIAYGASVFFNVSFALGAFFAGMVMRESKYSHRAAMESLPLRDAFSVIFFVGVGMMFDPKIIIEHPLHLMTALLLVLFFNPTVSFLLTLFMKCPLPACLTLGISLGQIGEFSFILSALGIELGVLPKEAMNLVLGVAIISIALNSLAFAFRPKLTKFLTAHFRWARVAAARSDPYAVLPDETDQQFLHGHVVLIGYKELGQQIYNYLTQHQVKVVVVDEDVAAIRDLRTDVKAAIVGDAQDPGVLLQAHVQNASMLIYSLNDDVKARKIVETARIINPTIEPVVRCPNEEIAAQLRDENLGHIIDTLAVLARAMSRYALERYGKIKTPESEVQNSGEK